MDPINTALRIINDEIPEEILKEAFLGRQRTMFNTYEQTLVSTDYVIREKVIENKVMEDMDLIGGTEMIIQLTGDMIQNKATGSNDPFSVIYNIPAEVTQNRAIVQVYSIHFGLLGYQQSGLSLPQPSSALYGQLRRVMDSALKTPPAATSYLNIIAFNSIMVRYMYMPHVNAFMRVRLGNDEALSHLRPQAYHDFAHLCVLAVKAFIYKTLIIKMDQGQLSGGQMLGEFKNIVMNYADATEMYREALVRWKKISIFNDPEMSRRVNQTLIGGL